MRPLPAILIPSACLALVGTLLLAQTSPRKGMGVQASLRPEMFTQSPILTKGESLILELEVTDPAGAFVDQAVLSGNALHCGAFGPALPLPKGERVRLAHGTKLVRKLSVPKEWFRLAENAGKLDLPAASLRWESPLLRIRGETFFYLDENIASARVEMVTSKGKMEFAFEPEKAPDHVKNFLRLVRAGFYDGTAFHRVIRAYMVQGGDPNTRDQDPDNDGVGRAPWQVAGEFSTLPHVQGVLSMARDQRDPDSASSQFFIIHGAREQTQLNGKFTVFGRLMSGDETLDAIASVKVGGLQGTAPKESVVLKRARILYPD